MIILIFFFWAFVHITEYFRHWSKQSISSLWLIDEAKHVQAWSFDPLDIERVVDTINKQRVHDRINQQYSNNVQLVCCIVPCIPIPTEVSSDACCPFFFELPHHACLLLKSCCAMTSQSREFYMQDNNPQTNRIPFQLGCWSYPAWYGSRPIQGSDMSPSSSWEWLRIYWTKTNCYPCMHHRLHAWSSILLFYIAPEAVAVCQRIHLEWNWS